MKNFSKLTDKLCANVKEFKAQEYMEGMGFGWVLLITVLIPITAILTLVSSPPDLLLGGLLAGIGFSAFKVGKSHK